MGWPSTRHMCLLLRRWRRRGLPLLRHLRPHWLHLWKLQARLLLRARWRSWLHAWLWLWLLHRLLRPGLLLGSWRRTILHRLLWRRLLLLQAWWQRPPQGLLLRWHLLLRPRRRPLPHILHQLLHVARQLPRHSRLLQLLLPRWRWRHDAHMLPAAAGDRAGCSGAWHLLLSVQRWPTGIRLPCRLRIPGQRGHFLQRRVLVGLLHL